MPTDTMEWITFVILSILLTTICVAVISFGSKGRVRKKRTGTAEAIAEAQATAQQRTKFQWKRLYPLILAAVAAIIIGAAWANHAELGAWLKGQLPSGAYTMPEWSPAWMTTTNVAAAMLLLGIVIVVLAFTYKTGGRQAAMLSGLLALAVVAAVFHTVIIAAILEAPDQIAWIWKQTYPIVARIALTVAVISIGIKCLTGIPNLKEFGEMAAALGAVILGGYILLYAIWNYDGSRNAYANAPPRQEWRSASAPTSPCDSREAEYTFETSQPAEPIMPLGQCNLSLWHRGHCVYTLSYGGSIPKKACDFGNGLEGEYAINTEYVWSADTAFISKYRPDPPRDQLLFSFIQ